MVNMDTWLEDIRIGYIISTSAATLRAWMGEHSMCKHWYGNPPYKVMVF